MREWTQALVPVGWLIGVIPSFPAEHQQVIEKGKDIGWCQTLTQTPPGKNLCRSGRQAPAHLSILDLTCIRLATKTGEVVVAFIEGNRISLL